MSTVQKRILLALTLLVAATRFVAAAASLWDWDEALFAMAVRDYDVVRHHPHPPGYPLFIAAGKLVHLAVRDEFRALQVVVVLAACALLPLLFALARELGFSFATSLGAGTLFAFLPNVWVYGGTAFSDIPALATALAACTLLLRGRRSSRAFLLGAVVLGLAAGVRLPNLLLGAVPALLATYAQLRARQYRLVAGAMLLGGLTVAASYLGAALASGGIPQFLESVRVQSAWVREVDSWRNPHRPPLHELAERFWFKPVLYRDLMLTIAILGALSVLVAILRRRAEVLLLFLMFGPLAIAAWLNLDYASVARYAIAYMPAHAIVAIDGLAVLPRRIQVALTAALIAWSAAWTWPAVLEQRAHPAPLVAAFEHALRTPPSTMLYVHDWCGPHAEYLLGDRRRTFYVPPRPMSTLGGDGVMVDIAAKPGAVNFYRERGRLWEIVRQRYFEASVETIRSPIRLQRGWYGVESTSGGSYQWMAAEGVATLQHIPGATLSLVVSVPQGLRPDIEVHWNGRLVERLRGDVPRIEKAWALPSRAGGNELRITTSETVRPPGGDPRDLGLRLDEIAWTR